MTQFDSWGLAEVNKLRKHMWNTNFVRGNDFNRIASIVIAALWSIYTTKRENAVLKLKLVIFNIYSFDTDLGLWVKRV